MAESNGQTLSQEQRLQQQRLQHQQQAMMNARRRQMEMMAAQQQREQQQQSMNQINSDRASPSQYQLQPTMTMQPQSMNLTSAYDDIPILEPTDLGFIGEKPTSFSSFESACQHGPLTEAQFIVSSENYTPSFLHHGLVVALSAGNVQVAEYLLSAGAPIVRQTPQNVLSAPSEMQIPLFELLMKHGWTPNTPGYYGALLLPDVVTNVPLLKWFLIHGGNPNLGPQRDNRDRMGGSDTDCCVALQTAAARGEVEAVRLLLDAGAEIKNGVPLHYAAGACPPGTNPHVARVLPSETFDQSRVPVMELLVERGADVNQAEESRHMVAKYAIVYAVMAGAVKRVKWLLEHGADPELKGAWGSAVEYARSMGSEEMIQVVEEGLAAWRLRSE
ncbi:Ankyrin repeat-containing domain protein [Rutstroemia sp. NJR-2017a WRK4]|nr:Ankyrin repeat-containing domain protein [Rutstroemia sp. NJR-2017a WRK4]PQE11767.1 Ankyrin repeat-containing domain protein [Rutstroemia sp. NJR-2017a WRK4]